MTSPLDGTVALVTGASSGIGAATAEALAADGASVVLCARRTDRIDELAATLRGRGSRALAVECDVTDEASVQQAVDRAVGEYGRLDTVVANAGVMLLGPLGDAPTEEWRRMVHTNVLGLMYTAHASLPHLVTAAGSGPRQVSDLLLVSSVAGRQVRSGSGAYNASKHAVGALGEALRQEFTARHVRVCLIEPGAVDTELASHNRDEIRETISKRFEGLERLTAEDIARTISFVVTAPRRMAINEVLVRPTDQVQ